MPLRAWKKAAKFRRHLTDGKAHEMPALLPGPPVWQS
jgi:hypothetical protein